MKLNFWQRMARTETLVTLMTFGTATVLCWFGKIDGMAWVASASMASGILTAARSYVKARVGEAQP